MTENQKNPIAWFAEAFKQAQKKVPVNPNAMTLATVDKNGRPSARVVLLKHFDDNGFVFYTNFNSRKGKALLQTPLGALCFYWRELDLQVRVEGNVQQVTDGEADEYFATRPRSSQIGAWASHQSDILETRETLDARFEEHEAKFANANVPRPPHWSGFRVAPEQIEFWENRPNRLHHRTLFTRTSVGAWEQAFLNP